MATIANGVRPLIPHRKDRSFKATFGDANPVGPDFNNDAGFGYPDQNADGRPNGCTGYAQSEICQDEDKAEYDPGFTYDMTRLVEGTSGQDVPCDVRDSLNTTIVYGLKRKDDPNAVSTDAYSHHRGAYYRVDEGPDYFSSILSAMRKYQALWGKPCSVSVASRWYGDFSMAAPNGVIPIPADWNSWYSMHNWKICGQKTINGVPYLIGKPWIGGVLGDGGYFYFSQEIFNKLLDFYFSGAFVLAPYTGDFFTVKLTTLELFVSMVSHLGLSPSALGKFATLLEQALNLS
jgi:hypothetical protein